MCDMHSQASHEWIDRRDFRPLMDRVRRFESPIDSTTAPSIAPIERMSDARILAVDWRALHSAVLRSALERRTPVAGQARQRHVAEHVIELKISGSCLSMQTTVLQVRQATALWTPLGVRTRISMRQTR